MATAFKQTANNAVSTTATSYAATGVTSTTVAAGTGALFPTPGNGFYATIWVGAAGSDPGSDANMEIVTVTARATDVMTHSATTKTHTGGTVNFALLDVAQNITDVQTATNNIENNVTVLAGVKTSGDIKIQGGHSLDLQNTAGNSDAFIYNNGATGVSILQSDAPMHLTAPDNTTNSVVTTTGIQTLNNKTLAGGTGYLRTAVSDANHTLGASTDFYVAITAITAPRTFTLPSVAGIGQQTFIIKDESGSVGSTNTLTIATTGGATIDGKTSIVLNRPYDTLQVECDGTNWKLIEIPQSLTGGSAVVDNEVPGGLVNSSNTVYTTASQFATNSLNVYRNGIRLKGGGVDYTVNAGLNGFTMTTAPNTGDLLLVDYNVWSSAFLVGTNSNITNETPTGTVNGTTTVFTTARAYIAGSLQVYIDGIMQRRGTDYTETTPSSGSFTMASAPLTGQSILTDYQFNLNPSSNADTVDGLHASSTATANQLLALDGSSQFPWSAIKTANGETALGSSFTISGASGTFQDTGLSVALPAAGTYEISADVRCDISFSAGTGGWINGKFFDATASADVPRSLRMLNYGASTGPNYIVTAPIVVQYTVTGAATIKLYCARNNATTWTASTVTADANGVTVMRYKRIA